MNIKVGDLVTCVDFSPLKVRNKHTEGIYNKFLAICKDNPNAIVTGIWDGPSTDNFPRVNVEFENRTLFLGMRVDRFVLRQNAKNTNNYKCKCCERKCNIDDKKCWWCETEITMR